MSVTGDLVAWLRACLDGDEELAKRAGFGWGQSWTEDCDEDGDEPDDWWDDWWCVHADGKRNMVGCEDGDVTTHIARHDPASVLADIAAKRALVSMHSELDKDACADYGYDVCQRCHDEFGMEKYPCHVLLILAQAYAGRPGWREGWSRG